MQEVFCNLLKCLGKFVTRVLLCLYLTYSSPWEAPSSREVRWFVGGLAVWRAGGLADQFPRSQIPEIGDLAGALSLQARSRCTQLLLLLLLCPAVLPPRRHAHAPAPVTV